MSRTFLFRHWLQENPQAGTSRKLWIWQVMPDAKEDNDPGSPLSCASFKHPRNSERIVSIMLDCKSSSLGERCGNFCKTSNDILSLYHLATFVPSPKLVGSKHSLKSLEIFTTCFFIYWNYIETAKTSKNSWKHDFSASFQPCSNSVARFGMSWPLPRGCVSSNRRSSAISSAKARRLPEPQITSNPKRCPRINISVKYDKICTWSHGCTVPNLLSSLS